ncbi:hypothetical protein DEU56DRAFT_123352 [Suillus clintonianus]|uniref:uncharacterized protein n=1 Tax=Suillus clintonianus TaxID=1904413 RepID=UPI001B87642F|nr:uncharacterized protein DEU56DRAFT_123352 [Suillus clintonianus]KAG2119356.1 hypothetical protein DEU56DRAFT_123352 [Suillus clintonianus]
MHRALHICEILLEIFAHVNKIQGRSYREDVFARRCVAALATTCKTFYEPAMNELWADMYGLIPLLGCVTRLYPMIYCGEKGYCRFNPPYFRGIEPLSENEGRQFLRHAARVRSMHIGLQDDYFHLLPVLACTVPCMFPRLLSLSIPHAIRYSDIFLSPTLRRCSLEVTYPDLKVITTRCAALESINLHDPNEETADGRSLLSDSLRLCKRLVTLSCPPLNLTAWEHLSNLPTLLKVTLCGGMIDPFPLHLNNNISFGPFLNLTTLCLDVATDTYVTALMQHSEFPSLKMFSMSVWHFSWAEVERLVRVLSQCKACQTLEHIGMRCSRSSGVHNPPGSSLTITHFRCFTQLRILRLDIPLCCIHLDNDIFLEAMSSWPHLRRLELEDNRQTRGTITFRGLFAALRQCPHLRRLELWIDAVNIDVDPTAESFQHTSLQEWHVESAQVMDAEVVARIIFSMLPCVHRLYHKHMSMNGDPPYAWPGVQRRLDHLRSSAVP